MKNYIKYFALLSVCISFCISAQAQTGTGSTGAKKSKTTTAKKPAPIPNAGKPITIAVKNTCEKPVSLFAGSKTGLKNPKPDLKTIGGLGTDKLYIKVADVVCIMNPQLKPVACADVKSTTASVEINSSGNLITAK